MLISLTVLVIAGYWWFIHSPYYASLLGWSQQHMLLFLFLLLAIKITGIVYPPLPSGLLTLGSIPFLGWPSAYATDFLGSMIGSSIAYYLGRRYGKAFLLKVFDGPTVGRITKMKVKSGKEIEGVFIMRILTGSVIVEAVCYGAGLLKVPYPKFLVGSIAAHLLVGIPSFYLAGSFFLSKNLLVSATTLIVSIALLYKLKGRYFE